MAKWHCKNSYDLMISPKNFSKFVPFVSKIALSRLDSSKEGRTAQVAFTESGSGNALKDDFCWGL